MEFRSIRQHGITCFMIGNNNSVIDRCDEAGVTYLNSKVEQIIESPDGHRIVYCEPDQKIFCRLAIVASGAASGKLLEYEVGGPRVCVQTAYGVEVEVHY
jgi:lycopene epsilon-cyclase